MESETVTKFKNTHLLGQHPDGKVWVSAEWDGKRLSISGVIGPLPNWDCMGSCGQIIDELGDITKPASGWNNDSITEFVGLWRAWHLNDMQAGCEHQRAEGWNERPIDPSKPTNTYGLHYEGQKQASWNMLTWVRPDEHPEGLLTKPCEVCGYKYGTAWLTKEVPVEVLARLQEFPQAAEECPWRDI